MRKIMIIPIALILLLVMTYLLIRFDVFSYKPKCRYIKNCDFSYNPSPDEWVTNGFYNYGNYTLGAGWYENSVPVNGRSTLMLMHPQSPDRPTTINQTFYLPVILGKTKYILRASVANIGNYWYETVKATGCFDNGFVLKIIDNKGQENKLLDTVVNSKDGWKEFKFDISNYNAQTVTVQLESWASGHCGFGGTFGAVDYIDVELVP
jgi:hypothetical protein